MKDKVKTQRLTTKHKRNWRRKVSVFKARVSVLVATVLDLEWSQMWDLRSLASKRKKKDSALVVLRVEMTFQGAVFPKKNGIIMEVKTIIEHLDKDRKIISTAVDFEVGEDVDEEEEEVEVKGEEALAALEEEMITIAIEETILLAEETISMVIIEATISIAIEEAISITEETIPVATEEATISITIITITSSTIVKELSVVPILHQTSIVINNVNPNLSKINRHSHNTQQ